ncbi:hypothetical protein MAAFP003_441 [Mycobacterium ahvazicum]|uniref:PPE-PPW subfamily C-terminal domain-containing protein n=1 Tax=Mycobacterium ahvazicum TaxID=1964395 RepID=A0A2K4Y4R7_9MYCO|nr:hypothetical protein MAAFP003_441 [Mycobacterium ahvazicum]
MNVDVDPDWVGPAVSEASGRGAGSLGFAGTARTATAEAAGLTTLAVSEFGDGPRMPMLPGSWDAQGGDVPHDRGD